MCRIVRYGYTCGHEIRHRLSTCRGTFHKESRVSGNRIVACKSEDDLLIKRQTPCGPCQSDKWHDAWLQKLAKARNILTVLEENDLPGEVEVASLLQELIDLYLAESWPIRQKFPSGDRPVYEKPSLGYKSTRKQGTYEPSRPSPLRRQLSLRATTSLNIEESFLEHPPTSPTVPGDFDDAGLGNIDLFPPISESDSVDPYFINHPDTEQSWDSNIWGDENDRAPSPEEEDLQAWQDSLWAGYPPSNPATPEASDEETNTKDDTPDFKLTAWGPDAETDISPGALGLDGIKEEEPDPEPHQKNIQTLTTLFNKIISISPEIDFQRAELKTMIETALRGEQDITLPSPPTSLPSPPQPVPASQLDGSTDPTSTSQNSAMLTSPSSGCLRITPPSIEKYRNIHERDPAHFLFGARMVGRIEMKRFIPHP